MLPPRLGATGCNTAHEPVINVAANRQRPRHLSPPNVDVAFGTTIRTSALREEVTCTATLVSLRAHPRASLIVLTASVHLKIMSEAVLYTNSAQLASSPFTKC